MTVPVRRWLLRAAQIALLAILAWGVYHALAPDLRGLRWEDLSRWRPSVPWLALSTVLLTGVYLAHVALWRRIARDLGSPVAGARTTLRVYALAALGRYIPGKLWQLAGIALLAQRAGLPPGTSAAAAVFGQIAFLTSGLFFTALLLPTWAGGAPAWIGAAILLVAGVGLWVIAATPAGHGLRARLTDSNVVLTGKAATALAIADRVRPRDAVRWELAYAATWIALGLAFALFVHAFSPVPVERWPVLMGTVAASYLAGYFVLLAPAGVGVRESALALLLVRVVPDASAAIVIAIASRLWFTVAELLPFALLPLLRDRAEPVAGASA